jgi:hypothetical protein
MKKFLFFYTLLLLSCTLSIGADNDIKSEFILPNGANISIVEDVFDKNNSTIKLCGNDFEICYINGYRAYGVVSDIPKTYIKNIKVFYQNQIYDLNVKGMYNAWGNRLKYAPYSLYFWGQCKDEYNCTFRGIFADAAAAFGAEWKIINGKSVRTILCHSMDSCFESLNFIPNLYENKSIKLNSQKISNTAKLNLSNGVDIVIVQSTFDKNKFSIKKCNHIDAICLINGRVPFGTSRTSYEIPKTYLKNITVNYKSIDYTLDVNDMYDMDIVKFGGTCNDELKSCAFRGIFSNKNGNFAAQWRLNLNINDKQSKIIALTSSKDVAEYFLKYIDADIFYE